MTLIGFGATAWDERIEQKESLLDPHIVRNQGYMLVDKVIHHGGEQCLKFYDGTVIPLKFDGETTMWLAHQTPTDQELEELNKNLKNWRSIGLLQNYLILELCWQRPTRQLEGGKQNQ